MRSLALAVSLLIAQQAPIRAAIYIDDFAAGEYHFSTPGSVLYPARDSDNILGNSRILIIESDGPEVDAGVDILSNSFEYSSPSVGGFTFIYFNSNNVDLAVDGSNAFRIYFPEVTPGAMQGTFTLSPGGLEYTIPLHELGAGGAPYLDVPFSLFTDEASYAPSSVRIIGSDIPPNHRVSFGAITTVQIPEPTTPLLASLGLALIGVRRRVMAGTS